MEKDYLAGLISVRLGLVKPEDHAALLTTLAAPDPESDSLAARLAGNGVLAPEQASLIESLVDEVIEVTGGDPLRTIETLAGGVDLKTLLSDFGSTVTDLRGDVVPIPEGDTAFLEQLEDAITVSREEIGRYTYVGDSAERAEIGRGGIGRVMQVKDEHIGREIAVKELLERTYKGEKDESASSRATASVDSIIRFLREARVTGQLEHPNIVPVYEVGRRDDGTFYYTMRLVRGRTLSDALDDCRTLQDRLKYLNRFVDVCNAIAYAHSRGVIHRDIKPQNVMLGEFGETVVLDWGLAKVRGRQDLRGSEMAREVRLFQDTEGSGETMMGITMGTPAYMSPEQAMGLIDDLDEQSDIWSLGAVLYEILTGRPPFSGRNANELLARVATSRVVPPRQLVPEIPPDLASVCEKCLQSDKEDRYRKARDVAAEIEHYQAGRRVGAYEYSAWELVRRLVVQHKAIAVLVVTIFMLLATGTPALYSAYREADASRVVAVEKRAEALAERRLAETARRDEEAARRRAQANEQQANHNLAVALREEAGRLLDERDYLSARIFASAALAHSPFNPYGKNRFGPEALQSEVGWNEMATLQSHLFLSEVERVASLETARVVRDRQYHRMALTDDGERVVVGTNRGILRVLSLPSLDPVREVKVSDARVVGVACLPASHQCVSTTMAGEIDLWDVETGRQLQHTELTGERLRGVTLSPDGALGAAGGWDGSIHLFRVPELTVVRTIRAHATDIRAPLCFTPDAGRLVSVGVDGTMRYWDVATGREAAPGQEDLGRVYALSVAPGGELALAGHEGIVRVFPASGNELPVDLGSYEGHCTSLSFSADGRLVAVGDHLGVVRLWDVHTGVLLETLAAHDSFVLDLEFSSDRQRLVTLGLEGELRVWKLVEPRVRHFAPAVDGEVYQLETSPAGDAVAMGSLNGDVAVWDLNAHRRRFRRSMSDRYVWALDFSPSGRHLAVSSKGRVVLLDARTGAERAEQSTGDSAGIAFADEKTLLVVSEDGVVAWTPEAGTAPTVLARGTSYLPAIAVSNSGKLAAFSAEPSMVQIIELPAGTRTQRLEGHEGRVSSIEFSPDDRIIASAGMDQTVRIWERESGRLLRTLSGHKRWVNTVRFLSDGTTLVSGADDNTLRLWDAHTGRLLLSHDLHHEVSGISVFPERAEYCVADVAAVRCYPVLVDLWQRDPADLQAEAERLAGRRLSGFDLLPLQEPE